MKVTKPEDAAAAQIKFGVEIETMIPAGSGVAIGHYHGGRAVTTGLDAQTQEIIAAPSFGGAPWRAERDGSIRCDPGYMPCEFVSPILYGDEGLAALRAFVKWANRIGAKVNHSCGCHITIGIASVIGSSNDAAVKEFVRKLAHLANHNSWAIYAQTGTDRHQNHYAHRLQPTVENCMRQLQRADAYRAETLASQCGRGMVNFQKVFNGCGAVEFRAFAGTLNDAKLMHHLATCLGLMRRAHLTQTLGRFAKSEKKHKSKTAVEALRRLWRVLGWVDSVPGRDCALGLFGALHAEFHSYRKVALDMSEKFETRFPGANL